MSNTSKWQDDPANVARFAAAARDAMRLPHDTSNQGVIEEVEKLLNINFKSYTGTGQQLLAEVKNSTNRSPFGNPASVRRTPVYQMAALQEATTLTGVPLNEISRALDQQYPDEAYKDIRLPNGNRGTDLNTYYVMNRLQEVFGPAGIGWRLNPHHDKGKVVRTTEKRSNAKGGEYIMHSVTLECWVFEYAIVINGVIEYIALSTMTETHEATDPGYAARGVFTSLLKQALRLMGGFNHFVLVSDL